MIFLSLLFSFTALIFGQFYDIFGRKIYIALCLLTISITLALAPTSIKTADEPNDTSLTWLYFNRILLGILCNIVLANPLIPDFVKKRYRGRAYVLYLLGFGVGSIAAIKWSNELVGEDWNLNKQFLYVGFVVCTISFVSFLMMKEMTRPQLRRPMNTGHEIQEAYLATNFSD
jgi:MFS family permease